MRKKLCILLIIVLAVCYMPAMTVCAATRGSCGNNLTWELDSYGMLTIRGTGAMKNYEPDMFEKNSKSSPWHYSKDIKDIFIEEGVTSIGDGAFYSCSNLRNVYLPESLKSIGEEAFAFCDNLKTIDIPDSVSSIGDAAFMCAGLTDIALPSSMETINVGVFWECDELRSVTIPESIKKICETAFFGCDILNNIYIPENVSAIELGAFGACRGLSNLTVSGSNTHYTVDYPGVLFNKNRDTLVLYPAGLGNSSYTIPDGVINIYPSAFYSAENLTDVIIPQSVVSIGEAAFRECDGLEHVEIPVGVKYIESHAFYGCGNLDSIKLPNTLEKFVLNDGSLLSCNKLKTLLYGGDAEQWIYLFLQSSPEMESDVKYADQLRAYYNYFGYLPVPGASTAKVYCTKSNDQKVRVSIDGVMVDFDQPPIIQNGRTLVPVRAVFENMGCDVDWDNPSQTVTIKNTDVEISFKIGSSYMEIKENARSRNKNDSVSRKTLDVPAQIINGRTLVPVRAISEALNCNVTWNGYSNTVEIAYRKEFENAALKKIVEKIRNGEHVKIGIVQWTPDDNIDNIANGIIDKLEDSDLNKYIETNFQTASGDPLICSAIAKHFQERTDLIIAYPMEAAQIISNETHDIPIISSTLTEPINSGLFEENKNYQDRMIFETCGRPSVEAQISLIEKIVPNVGKIAVFYGDEHNSTSIDVLKDKLDEMGISSEFKAVNRNSDLRKMTNSLDNDVEAIYAPADNIMLDVMGKLSEIATEKNLPVICENEEMVNRGGLVAYKISYYGLGCITGEMVLEVLRGDRESIYRTPLRYLPEDMLSVVINWDRVKELGINIPSSLVEKK